MDDDDGGEKGAHSDHSPRQYSRKGCVGMPRVFMESPVHMDSQADCAAP